MSASAERKSTSFVASVFGKATITGKDLQEMYEKGETTPHMKWCCKMALLCQLTSTPVAGLLFVSNLYSRLGGGLIEATHEDANIGTQPYSLGYFLSQQLDDLARNFPGDESVRVAKVYSGWLEGHKLKEGEHKKLPGGDVLTLGKAGDASAGFKDDWPDQERFYGFYGGDIPIDLVRKCQECNYEPRGKIPAGMPIFSWNHWLGDWPEGYDDVVIATKWWRSIWNVNTGLKGYNDEVERDGVKYTFRGAVPHRMWFPIEEWRVASTGRAAGARQLADVLSRYPFSMIFHAIGAMVSLQFQGTDFSSVPPEVTFWRTYIQTSRMKIVNAAEVWPSAARFWTIHLLPSCTWAPRGVPTSCPEYPWLESPYATRFLISEPERNALLASFVPFTMGSEGPRKALAQRVSGSLGTVKLIRFTKDHFPEWAKREIRDDGSPEQKIVRSDVSGGFMGL